MNTLKYLVTFLIVVLLVSNIVGRLYVLHIYSINLNLILLSFAIVFWLFQKYSFARKTCLLVLGLSLPLYGFQSYTIYSGIFELFVAFLCCCLLFHLIINKKFALCEGLTVKYLSGFLFLTLTSVLLLPVLRFTNTILLWGPLDFGNALFTATPDNPLYALASANRLLVFAVFIVLLSRTEKADRYFQMVFLGCGCSVLVACSIGLLNHYGLISLEWYRPQFAGGRLHSVIGNPGWFSEYVLICFPFVLLILSRLKGKGVRALVFSLSLLLIGASLLLTGSRTGWLIFPVAATCCYVILQIWGGEGITWMKVKKSFLHVGIAALGFCILGGAAFWVSGQGHIDGIRGGSNLSQERYIIQRIRNIANPSVRLKIWHESMALLSESPWFGLGYETYRWHQDVMMTVPSSKYAQHRQTINDWDTAHNFYIQLLLDNGIFGLILWSTLTGLVAVFLLRDVRLHHNMNSAILLIALFIFHLYGITQAMQYIAPIYFLVFLIIGYVIQLENKAGKIVIKRLGEYGLFFIYLVVGVGAITYALNFESRNLADRYKLSNYGVERGAERFKGFYKKENWGKKGVFRWTGKQAEIEFSREGTVQLDYACYAPRLEQAPITVDVSLSGRLIDQYTFRKGETVTRNYSIYSNILPATLKFKVSRTWNPKREHLNSDTRNLGIAVSMVRYRTALQAIPINRSRLKAESSR